MIQPEPHLAALDEYEGLWVAVKDRHVVAKARTSKELAFELHQKGITGATIQFVSPPTYAERVGLG